MAHLLSWYIVCLGAGLILFSTAEFMMPEKVFSLWKKWISHRLFFLHGFIIMAGGLPLTFFRDTLSGKIMMGIGIIVVFTGPFLVLFPEKMREAFAMAEAEMGDDDKSGIIYFDALVRSCAGIFFIFTILSYGSL